MPLVINKKCCDSGKQVYKFDTLITFGKKYTNQFSATPLPDKEEYTIYAQVKTTSPHTQHYNKNFAVTPLDFDTKITVRYTDNTKKIQNDWYVLIKNHQLRVKSIINVDKQNDYIVLYTKTEQATV